MADKCQHCEGYGYGGVGSPLEPEPPCSYCYGTGLDTEWLRDNAFDVLRLMGAPIYDNRQYSFRVEPWYFKKKGW